MRVQESYGVLARRRAALLKKLSKVGPIVMATACHMKVRCGNPQCKCATDKEARHPKFHLSYSSKERHTTQYVPVGLHQEVQEWIDNYWTLMDQVKELSEMSRQMIRLYARSQKKGKGRRSAPRKASAKHM